MDPFTGVTKVDTKSLDYSLCTVGFSQNVASLWKSGTGIMGLNLEVPFEYCLGFRV